MYARPGPAGKEIPLVAPLNSQSMSLRFHTADVFTDRIFGGNPLAVFPDGRELGDEQMLAITREFNFSETVFVLPPADPRHTRRLRIFTPAGELPFAGHPTLGAAFVLARTGEIPFTGADERIVFEEGVGPVPVLITGSPAGPSFTQLTAARLPEAAPSPIAPSDLARLLSLHEDDVISDGSMRPEKGSCGVPFLFVPLRSSDALARAKVRSDVLDELTITVGEIPDLYPFTVDGRADSDVVNARMFAPGLGIAEDPATGGAAAALTGYLSSRSQPGDSTLRWTINQGVAMGRPSRLEIEGERSGGSLSAVRVGGSSVLVTSGTLHL